MPEGGGIKHTLSAPQGLHLQHNLVQILCGHLVSDCLQEEAIPCEIHGSESLPVPPFPPENAIQIRLFVVVVAVAAALAQTRRVLPPMKRGERAKEEKLGDNVC